MSCDYFFECKVIFTNGKSVNLITGAGQSEKFIPYNKKIDWLNKKVESYLVKYHYKPEDIKQISINIEYLSEEEIFFYDLLNKTEEKFKASATRKKYPNENWNFAICDTPIQKGKGLFFGLNWGGDDINQQTVYPPKEKDRNWKFITQSRPYFKNYFKERIENLNYSNLCFFRSPDIEHFESSDWGLAIPLFREYVNYIKPAWTLMLGKPNHLKTEIENFKRHEVINKSNNRRVFGYTGKLFGKYPFGSVPHTESQISSEARHAIWSIVKNHLPL